jgi:hypothetical protein
MACYGDSFTFTSLRDENGMKDRWKKLVIGQNVREEKGKERGLK